MIPRLAISILFSAVVAFVAFSSRATAQQPDIHLWQIEFATHAELQELASQLDIWEVDYATRTILVPLTHSEAQAWSARHTVTLASDQSPLSHLNAQVASAQGIPGYECYRTVDETFATLDQLALDYPHLVTATDIGDSWNKTNAAGSGDDLRVLVLTNKAITQPKFRFFLVGAVHAREYVTTELALRFGELLLESYGRDANATWLLDHGELHLLAIANPDGRRIAETGILWRKNTNTDAACSTVSLPSRSYGVDLNRNSSYKWSECDGFSCSSGDSCRETYRGESPASEPEVQAIEAYLRAIFSSDAGEMSVRNPTNSPSGIFVSLHSYGQLVMFPWGHTSTLAPDAHGLATLAQRMAYPLAYNACQAGGFGCLYQTDGTQDDFAYGELGIPSFTIEFGTAFFQSCSYFNTSILEQGMAALRYAFTAAPQPYALAQGPEIVELSVSAPNDPTPSPSETQPTYVNISATVRADRFGVLTTGIGQEPEPDDLIRHVALTIDNLPWEGTAYRYALPAADGLFDSAIEHIDTTLETACLPSGRHTLYMQAEDNQGDRGVVAAEFVTVTNTSPFTVTLQSEPGVIKTGDPITYTLLLTNSAPATATFTLEAQGEDRFTLEPSMSFTLGAGATIPLQVIHTPNEITASTYVPAVIRLRMVGQATHCRQLEVATEVNAWAYRLRLIFIAKH